MQIDEYAFYNCASLQSVTILNPMIKINISAFAGCKALTQVNLPKGLTRSKMKNKFADSPWVKNKPISANKAAEKAKKEKLEALAAASASAIVKHALDEISPDSAIAMINSDNKSISIQKDIIGGINLYLSFNVPKKMEDVQQFASALAEYLRQIRNLFSNCFANSSKECGSVLLTCKEKDLVMSVKLDGTPTKGGNYVDMNLKEVEVNDFLNSEFQLKKIIEKFDGWEGVNGNVYLSLRKHHNKLRYDVSLTGVYEAPKNLEFIDCINSMHFGCFKKCRYSVESVTIPRKLLSDANTFDDCHSLKVIHIV